MNKGKTTESIFSGKSVVIPLAEVLYVQRDVLPPGTKTITVMFRGCTWNLCTHEYTNTAYLDDPEEAQRFLKVWCHYRREIESPTILDITPVQPRSDQGEVKVVVAQPAKGEPYVTGVYPNYKAAVNWIFDAIIEQLAEDDELTILLNDRRRKCLEANPELVRVGHKDIRCEYIIHTEKFE